MQQFKASAVALFDAVTITQCEEVLERASDDDIDANACSEREFDRALSTTFRSLWRDKPLQELADRVNRARKDDTSMGLNDRDVRVLNHFMRSVNTTLLDAPNS